MVAMKEIKPFTLPENPTREEAIALYRKIRSRSEARTPVIFDQAVKAEIERRLPLGDKEPNLWGWLDAASKVTFTCRRCAGTGAFITGTMNGQPTGPGGICFRCQGRGVQNDDDARRNYGHDLHYCPPDMFE